MVFELENFAFQIDMFDATTCWILLVCFRCTDSWTVFKKHCLFKSGKGLNLWFLNSKILFNSVSHCNDWFNLACWLHKMTVSSRCRIDSLTVCWFRNNCVLKSDKGLNLWFLNSKIIFISIFRFLEMNKILISSLASQGLLFFLILIWFVRIYLDRGS